MSNIVTIVNDEALTTSLTIAEGVERPHKNVLELVRNNLSDFEEFGRVAFETRSGETRPQGGTGRPTEVALLNQQQATLLMTYMRNIGVVREFKKRLVKAFYELTMARQVPQNLSKMEILQMAMESEQEKLALKHEVEELMPKAVFHDKVVASEDAVSVGEAAKIIGTGRNRLLSFLRQQKWVTRRNEPYQAKIESGYMDVKLGKWEHPEQGLQRSVTPLVTGRGLAELQHMYRGVA